jgi:epoxyqueuosine reductase
VSDPELLPVRHASLDLLPLLRLTPDEYRARFYGTALARAGHAGLVRNAALAAPAARDPRLLPELGRLLGSELPGVAEAARWAIGRMAEPAP